MYYQQNREREFEPVSELAQIQAFVQSCAQTVAVAMEVAVVVVDKRLVRVGGTGPYIALLDRRTWHEEFFRRVLSTGAPELAEDMADACDCDQGLCQEQAAFAYPVFWRRRIIGVMAFVALDSHQKQRLLDGLEQAEQCLAHAMVLIESKLKDQREKHMLEQTAAAMAGQKRAEFTGDSGPAREVRDFVNRVAMDSEPALLLGERGSGKRTVAEMIHARSSRGGLPLMSVNCRDGELGQLGQELFGDGGDRAGKWALSGQTTLYVENVDKLPYALQEALAKQLLQGSGGRLICSALSGLEILVEQGRCSEELFSLLSPLSLQIPSLRERPEDIPALIDRWLERWNCAVRFTQEAYRLMMEYPWPGNTSELKSVVEYLTMYSNKETVTPADLPDAIRGGEGNKVIPKAGPLSDMVEEYEGRILSVLAPGYPTTKDKERLAAELNISRATLYRKLDKYDLLGNS